MKVVPSEAIYWHDSTAYVNNQTMATFFKIEDAQLRAMRKPHPKSKVSLAIREICPSHTDTETDRQTDATCFIDRYILYSTHTHIHKHTPHTHTQILSRLFFFTFLKVLVESSWQPPVDVFKEGVGGWRGVGTVKLELKLAARCWLW